MKKTKKLTLSKTLLILTAIVLVAAISISVTLAYLTAETEVRNNVFTSAANISGETIEPYGEEAGEPGSNSNVNYTYQPGNTYDKDPLIHNKTLDSDVYVGARLDFYIAVTKDGNDNPVYRQVPYDLFTKYVTINGSNVVPQNTTTAGKWEEIAVSTAVNTNDNTVSPHTDFSTTLGTEWSKYYVYNSVLARSVLGEHVGTGTNPNTYQIGETDNQSGSTSGNTSISAPIFTSVTPSGNITISRTLPTAEGTSANAGSYTTVLYADGPDPGDVYQCFDFKIVVNGYGVAADSAASRNEVINHLKQSLSLPESTGRIDVTTASSSNAQLKASHS